MKNTSATIKRLKKIGIFSASVATAKFGVSQPTLSRWVKAGLVERVGRGLYQHPEADSNIEYLDFAVACATFGPKSAIGGLSALSFYGLIEQVPTQIWIIVPPHKRNSKSLYRCLRTKTSFRYGIEKMSSYYITSIERTLIESLKFASKIGPRIVIQTTRKAIQQGLTTEVKLGQMARQLKLHKILEKYWEALVT